MRQGVNAVPYFVSDKPGKYQATRALTEAQIIKAALVLSTRAVIRGDALTAPCIVEAYLRAMLRHYEHEVFCCLWLDNQHRALGFEEMFRGTIDEARLYPREVVKRALQVNAAAVVFAHNHPSGVTEPSHGDKNVTTKLKQVLALVDILVLDHFVIGDGSFSFSENGLI